MPDRPNVLFIMTDQQRADTIAALGNPHIYTPNFDRLVQRGLTFPRAYSTCPVCVAARYTIRTGCEPPTTRAFSNRILPPAPGMPDAMQDRCGPYLPRTMTGLGYRTFGIGKFHTNPVREDLGYQTHLYSEELYGSPQVRATDDYARFIAREHPQFDYIETLHGERTEMYYMPQMSPLPAHLTVEAWAADRAVEQISQRDDRPWFGFVSFIGPHPPLAPPVPFNRLYDPDRMPNPVRGDLAVDHMDEQIPLMNYMIWADDVSDSWARAARARYYGEITYIDHCLGRVLDAVDALPDAENTLICMFSDHGDHLGDHSAWQKESFFDASCRVPFLLSWPAQLARNQVRSELTCLTDLFGIATSAAGQTDVRQGHDLLGAIRGSAPQREHVVGSYGQPGTPQFKLMVRRGAWKYIYLANGGREQLFNLEDDPHELRQRIASEPDVARELRRIAIGWMNTPGASEALEQGELRCFDYEPWPRKRIYQFAGCRGVQGFAADPAAEIARYFDASC